MEDNATDKGLSPVFYSHFFNEGIYLIKDKMTSMTMRPRESVIAENDIVYSESVFAFSGNIRSHILLLFLYPGKNDLPVKDKIFLEKILGAIGLSLESIAWLNMADYPETTWAEMAQNPQFNTLVAFNIKNSFFPDTPFGEIAVLNDKNVFLYHSLEEISADAEKKKVLWSGLKKMFNK